LVLTLAKPLPRIRRSAASKIFSFVSTSTASSYCPSRA
jgi:hypothetical protein